MVDKGVMRGTQGRQATWIEARWTGRGKAIGRGRSRAQTFAMAVDRPFDTPGHWSERCIGPLKTMHCAKGVGCAQKIATAAARASRPFGKRRCTRAAGACSILPQLPHWAGKPPKQRHDGQRDGQGTQGWRATWKEAWWAGSGRPLEWTGVDAALLAWSAPLQCW